ncbi:sensor histidine kinase [Mucilaginibacter sp.]|uniref:tetratricopeptide repeat-containing sensor histidine kinase n=1 Tax=Mucilaginibacter sp. TaxID=1882438 RepID=UPI0025CEB35E|nr:sensor histidine kinase [Mucilaginibacter sp.]
MHNILQNILSKKPIAINTLFIVLFISCSVRVYGQENWKQQRNLLLKQLSENVDERQKADRLFNLGVNYEANNPDSAVYYYEAGNKLSIKIGYNIGKMRYLACMTEVLENQAKYPAALKLCLQAIDLAKKINKLRLLAAAYNNTASIYDDLGNRIKTLEYFQQAINLYEQLKTKSDSANLATVYGNVLAIYSSLEMPEKAYAYGIKAIAFSRATKNNDALLVAYANLGSVLAKMNRTDTAMVLIEQQYELAKRLNDESNAINALGSMSSILLATNKLTAAKANAEEMLLLSAKTKDVKGVGLGNYFLSLYYFKLKDYNPAGYYARQAVTIFTVNKINNADVHLLLSDIALATGDLPTYNKQRGISDSLRNVEVSGKILKYNQELQVQYAVSKKESEIKSLHEEQNIQKLTITQQKIISWVFGGSVIIVGLIGYLYYRYYRQKNRLLAVEDKVKQQRITELEQEQKLLATETMLRSQEEERKRIAKDLHDGLGGILSGAKFSLSSMKQNFILTQENVLAFERTMEMLDQSITELRRVVHNMMPETLLKLTFDEALADYCQQITNSGALNVTYQSFGTQNVEFDNTVKITVYRMAQELVNNVIKHAGASTGMVQLIVKGNELNLTVEDNGKGFDVETLPESTGIGYKSLLSRVGFLNGKIDIQSVKNKGTHVYIEVPV